eukprot:COSAG04_NODE_147_length_22902_cov_55.666184_13_plen_86_part_00
METTLGFSAAEYRGFRAPQARSDYTPPAGQTLSNTAVRIVFLCSDPAPCATLSLTPRAPPAPSLLPLLRSLRDSLNDAARSSRCG